MPEWKSAESYQKLLAAMVAAQDLKLDYRTIASYYGDGATYDSIEGRFRIIKKQAKLLKDELDSGARPGAPPRGGNDSASSTPKKPRATKQASLTPKKEKVVSGRVSKAKNTKGGRSGGMGAAEDANVVNGIKQETISSGSSLYGGGEEGEDGVGSVFEGLDLEYDGGYGGEEGIKI